MSAKKRPLKVVLCWHMHQPDYRGPGGGDYQLPWVYLHGTKDYADMASHLEQHPSSRAVVNFAPVLLEQIDDYAAQIQAWLETGQLIRDPLLAALAGPGLPVDKASRQGLITACLRANESHLIHRFPVFTRLVELVEWIGNNKGTDIYLNDQFLTDLLVWYHLAWMGESIRHNDLRIKSLEKKGQSFDADDRRRLVEVIGEVMGGLVGRYRNLAESGQVELSVTPYAHPILPLLLDIASAREAAPEMMLPELKTYPGGESRARWHVRKGIEVFERHFGFRPRGCWPAEGSVSEETVRILEEEGFQWAASGQQVLQNSLASAGDAPDRYGNWPHTSYRVLEGNLCCFFRDDGLSDLIGFTYANWHADDAVGNLVQHLEDIAEACAHHPDSVVSIILDGENAWEYYPNNAHYFLSALYARLVEHPAIKLTTFSDVIDAQTAPVPRLSKLVAGSWVYGTFSTWVGERDKNRGWEMLGEAKKVYDRVVKSGRLTDEQLAVAELQLATCEGSDWFWWLGDYNPDHTVRDFEKLFRQQLTHLYLILGEPPPEYLSRVFARGSGDPAMGGVMKKN